MVRVWLLCEVKTKDIIFPFLSTLLWYRAHIYFHPQGNFLYHSEQIQNKKITNADDFTAVFV